MTLTFPSALVSTTWLADNLDHQDLTVLDGSWYLPNMNRDAAQEYKEVHIPGAIFADIDVLSDPSSPLPHTMPNFDDFARQLGNMGLAADDVIVVYDTGLPTAARIWYMLKVMGHTSVAVLDGGLKKWLAEERPVISDLPQVTPTQYHASPKPDLLLDLEAMTKAQKAGTTQVVDVRPRDRYEGTVPEPRPGVRAGHIPGAFSLPFFEFIDPETNVFLSPPAFRQKLEETGLSVADPVIAYCGSGVTACNLALASEAAGGPVVKIYDGSWSEWGASPNHPLDVGPPPKK